METKICELISVELSHPNLVKIHEVIDEIEYVYIIMEDVDGGELLDAIKDAKRLPEPTTQRWFKQLMETVQFMHTVN